jgi:two-component system, OmpR family, phosphate regulon sensor histidine kinase PhoR
MNKNLIKLIILIISFVLLSLIAVQVYWVKITIAVERMDFENKVNEAVVNVINRLEKVETYEQLQSTLIQQANVNRFIRSIDTINMLLSDSIFQSSDLEEIKKIIRKTYLARDVLGEMMDDQKPIDIQQALSAAILDSLLGEEFAKKGIRITYEFGVFSSSLQKLVFERTGQYQQELIDNSFVFTLYPGDLTDNPDYLMVYFPFKNRFLIKQTASMILISLILIVIIMMLFIYVIKIIVWQNRLSEMKTDFINNMTHEIKTPIATISLACEALNDVDIKKNEVLAGNYLKVISDENLRLGGIAEKILQNALIEKEDFRLRKEKVNIHEIIDHVIKNTGIHVEVKDGKITKEFFAENPFILADKWHITTAISNLIDNATKYTPRKPLIKVSTSNYAEGVTVSVNDNGIGISRENQKKIFDKLYRVPTGNVHDVKGFGLGLTYVKNIVERHGGRVEVDSELKIGSTFIVFLPFTGKTKKTENI